MFDSVTAVALAFLLDLLLGDPRWLPHPVRGIGLMITRLEPFTRRCFPKTTRGAFWAGVCTSAVTIVFATGFAAALLWAAGLWGRRGSFLLQILLCWTCLAARSLRDESMTVYHKLCAHDLTGARVAVARIVGRDTDSLTAAQVARATVETVAENTSDGVIAPLCFLLLGGAPLGFLYKAVNTLDSMIGYRNEQYLHFGRFAAKLDDLFNWIPARLSAILMIPAVFLLDLNGPGAIAVWRRDRRKHASPNSAQTESVCAGALGVQLMGDAVYGGTLVQKPTLGDDLRPIAPEDIRRANRLMFTTAVFALLLLSALRMMGIILL